MKKIPTIFKRDPDNLSRVLDEPNELCDWVFRGEGDVCIKYDGTCCMIRDNKLYRRHTVKFRKKIPENFIHVETDHVTKKQFGWVPVSEDNPNNKYHLAAFPRGMNWPDGTYELLGPKIQGNRHGYSDYVLQPHDSAVQVPMNCDKRTYNGLRFLLRSTYKFEEGFIFRHPDGRMGKIKGKDFD